VQFLCVWYFVCLGIFGFLLFYVVSTSAVELIAWKDSQNDQLCVERDAKHVLTHSLTGTSCQLIKADAQNNAVLPYHMHVAFSSLINGFVNDCLPKCH